MVIGSVAIVAVVGGDDDSNHDLEAYRGLAKSRPGLAFPLTVFLLAQAGVPLTAGFLAKFYVLTSLVGNGSYAAAVFAMLTAVIAAFFYLRLVIVMYSDPKTVEVIDESAEQENPNNSLIISPLSGFVVGVALIVTLVLGVVPGRCGSCESRGN